MNSLIYDESVRKVEYMRQRVVCMCVCMLWWKFMEFCADFLTFSEK